MPLIGQGRNLFDDTPVNGETEKGISSNWAFDHAANKDAHHLVFVDRGDPLDYDFHVTDFTTDNAIRDLSLATIIPTGAIAALLQLRAQADAAYKLLKLLKKGDTAGINASVLITQVAYVLVDSPMIITLDSNRNISYQFEAATWAVINLTVRGWFI